MTEEEIKKMGRAFAEETSNGDALDPHIDFAEGFATEVLQWLSKDYAIVPKRKVRERYKESKLRSESEIKSDILIGNARVSLLETLFDKSLFEEEK
ncbi:MAG: hypothetical protein K2H46_03845 [Muribaculaceae bacterium]|nr:hypothetical protein [Muribaculaceae bacterium]